MDKKLITRAYILTEEEKEFILQYHLVTEQNKDRAYGVEIHMASGSREESETCYGLSKDLSYTLQIIDRLARNFVMPISLLYIVEDNDLYDEPLLA